MRRWSIGAAILLVSGGISLAGGTDVHYGLDFRSGVDSNPLQVSNDGPNGLFGELAATARLTHRSGRVVTWLLDGAASTTAHTRRARDADATAARFTAGGLISPGTSGRLALLFTGHYAIERGTLVDPATGQTYLVSASDPLADPVAIPDRLDTDSSGVRLKLRWRQTRRLTLSLDTSLERTSYVENYGDVTALDPLDHDSLTVEPTVSYTFTEALTLGVGYSLTDLDYDARPALDGSGGEVAGTTRSYRYSSYRIWTRWSPAAKWQTSLGYSDSARDDRFAGYYDNTTRQSYLLVERELDAGSTLGLHLSVSENDYDSATVTGNPGDEIRSREARQVRARYQRGAGPATDWFVEAGTRNDQNRDPTYEHDRTWVATGIKFRR